MKISTFLTSALLLFSNALFSQMAVNTDGSQSHPSAMLDVKSTSKGILLPRLTNVERDAIVSPAEGLIIYNSVENKLQVFNGSRWKVFTTIAPASKSSENGSESIPEPGIETEDQKHYSVTKEILPVQVFPDKERIMLPPEIK